MNSLLLLVFALGYLAIVLEHPLGISKTASALLTGILCWTLLALGSHSGEILPELSHHLAEISEVLFFLLGAMTIVEIIDSHYGFRKITALIRSGSPVKLLWMVSWLSFFLSALLDNLTTAIVMASIVRKMTSDRHLKLSMISMIVIAANAGGAWSPIGDVTTTMLWVGGQIETGPLIRLLFLPSVLCLLVPLLMMSFMLRKTKILSAESSVEEELPPGTGVVLAVGVGGLLFVPVFKNLTHLPPYLGILLVLSVVWMLTEALHRKKSQEEKSLYTPSHALSKIDTPSILFFLGILLAVSALETAGMLEASARWLDGISSSKSIIMGIIGVASAIVDNVPLVAAAMGMYNLQEFPAGDPIWLQLAYTAGTGGSILIIGSAAGVAVMGMENIDFTWYLKRISFPAFAGFLAGYLLLLALL